jgi:hypothetical protein
VFWCLTCVCHGDVSGLAGCLLIVGVQAWQFPNWTIVSVALQLSPPPPPLHMAAGLGPTAFHEQLRYRDAQIAKLAGGIRCHSRRPQQCNTARY